MPDLTQIRALTFDCYGTLIDWESGILAAARRFLAGRINPADDQILETYGTLEAQAESGPYRPYREVLSHVGRGLADHFHLPAPTSNFLADSLPDWPAFPDTAAALTALGRRYRLVICSNIDRDLFAATLPKLGVTFAHIITAQDVLSYKPNPAHFHAALKALNLPKEQVLHVAQSLYHDIGPTRALGWSSVWINRRRGRPSPGATPPAHATPTLELPDLASLAAHLRGPDL